MNGCDSLFQLTVSGESGDPVASAPRPVEEDLNISPGAVIHPLQLMVENIAVVITLKRHNATLNPAVSLVM